jgi:hypothetical protein
MLPGREEDEDLPPLRHMVENGEIKIVWVATVPATVATTITTR